MVDRVSAKMRDELVMQYQGLVRFIAYKFANQGEPLEDIVQVGNVGLIEAIDRFDPARGTKLSTYVTPCIIGIIKRHFRDRGHPVYVSARMQEFVYSMCQAEEALCAQLCRKPTSEELAIALNVSEEEVICAQCAYHSYQSSSFGRTYEEDDGEIDLLDVIGENDQALEYLHNSGDISWAIDCLPDPRMKKIIVMHFYNEMSQEKIGKEIGISQMQVSRLYNRALKELKMLLNPVI